MSAPIDSVIPGRTTALDFDHVESRELQRLRRVIEFERTAASRWIERARAEVRRSRVGFERALGAKKDRVKICQQEFIAALERIDADLAQAQADTNTRALNDSTPATPAQVADGVEAAWRAMYAPEEPTSPAPTEAENPLLWAQVRAIAAAVQP